MNRCRGSTTLSKRCRRELPTGQRYCPTHIDQEQYLLIQDNKNENIDNRFKIISKTRRPPELIENHFIVKQVATRDKYLAFIFAEKEFVNTQFWLKLKNPGWTNDNGKFHKKDLMAIILPVN